MSDNNFKTIVKQIKNNIWSVFFGLVCCILITGFVFYHLFPYYKNYQEDKNQFISIMDDMNQKAYGKEIENIRKEYRLDKILDSINYAKKLEIGIKKISSEQKGEFTHQMKIISQIKFELNAEKQKVSFDKKIFDYFDSIQALKGVEEKIKYKYDEEYMDNFEKRKMYLEIIHAIDTAGVFMNITSPRIVIMDNATISRKGMSLTGSFGD